MANPAKRIKLSVDYEAFDFDTDPNANGSKDGLIEEDEPLSWRLNETDSLSDWTIVISDQGADTVYHVHRNILAVGPRKSDYFSRLFLSTTQFAESTAARTILELESSAAAAFPKMLDFLYSIGELEVTTEHAVALRHLSKYFGIAKLFVEVADFIRDDLKPETATAYLKEAAVYHDDKLLKAACGLCVASTERAALKSLLVGLRPDLFHLIISYLKLFVSSETISVHVAEFLRCHPDVADGPCFLDITSHKVMPRVDSSEALFFLSLPMTQSSALGDNVNDPSLQKRCIAACSRDWKKVLADPLKASSEAMQLTDSVALPELEKLSPRVQIKLLQSALCAADTSLSKKDDETEAIVVKKDSEIRELHVLVKDLQEIHCDIMERERGNKADDEETDASSG